MAIWLFKYMDSMHAAETGVTYRVKAAWAKWRYMSGIMCYNFKVDAYQDQR